jgi:hypothetical protein
MTTHVDILRVRDLLGRKEWMSPEPFGPRGWGLVHVTGYRSVIITCSDDDGIDWRHASMTAEDGVPTYEDLKLLHRAAFVHGGWAYQCFAPPSEHISIHDNALHLWGHCDGSPALQNFGRFGTI